MFSIVAMFVAAGVIAVVLFVPFSVRVSGAVGEDELWGVAELRWGPSLATVRLTSGAESRLHLLGIPLFRVSAPGRRRKEKKKTRKRRGLSLSRLAIHDRQVLARMATRGLRALHPRLYVGGTVGLADPANSALMLTAVRRIDDLVTDRVELEIRDDLLEDRTQLFGRVYAWVIPAEIVLILLVWMIRSDTRGVLRGR